MLLSWRVVRIVHGLMTSAKLGTETTDARMEQATTAAAATRIEHLTQVMVTLNTAHSASVASADAKSAIVAKQKLEGAVKAIAADVEKQCKELGHQQARSRMKVGTPRSGAPAQIGSAKSRMGASVVTAPEKTKGVRRVV